MNFIAKHWFRSSPPKWTFGTIWWDEISFLQRQSLKWNTETGVQWVFDSLYKKSPVEKTNSFVVADFFYWLSDLNGVLEIFKTIFFFNLTESTLFPSKFISNEKFSMKHWSSLRYLSPRFRCVFFHGKNTLESFRINNFLFKTSKSNSNRAVNIGLAVLCLLCFVTLFLALFYWEFKPFTDEWQTIREYPNYLPLILNDSIKMLFKMGPFSSQVLEIWKLK